MAQDDKKLSAGSDEWFLLESFGWPCVSPGKAMNHVLFDTLLPIM